MTTPANRDAREVVREMIADLSREIDHGTDKASGVLGTFHADKARPKRAALIELLALADQQAAQSVEPISSGYWGRLAARFSIQRNEWMVRAQRAESTIAERDAEIERLTAENLALREEHCRLERLRDAALAAYYAAAKERDAVTRERDAAVKWASAVRPVFDLAVTAADAYMGTEREVAKHVEVAMTKLYDAVRTYTVNDRKRARGEGGAG